ncbi:hypothetical protein LSAT2_015668 [Lamellibrachia satsuma]|nr:hypothetical protein LSAT2_015668 [Lamellibrachia satsuma]
MSVAVCVILVANALVNSAAATDSWTKSEFPDPQLNVDVCGNNGSKSWVCDPARLLTRQEVTFCFVGWEAVTHVKAGSLLSQRESVSAMTRGYHCVTKTGVTPHEPLLATLRGQATQTDPGDATGSGHTNRSWRRYGATPHKPLLATLRGHATQTAPGDAAGSRRTNRSQYGDAHHVTVRTWRRPVHFPSTWETRCGSLETATTKVVSQTDVSPWPRTESCVRKKLSDLCVRMVVNETSDIFKDRSCGTGLTYIPKQYLEVQSGKRDCDARSVGTTPGVVFGIFGVVAGVMLVYVFTYFCCGSCCDNSGDVNSSKRSGGHRPKTANRTRGNYLGSAHHSSGTGDVVVFVGGGGCGSGLGGDGGVGFEDGGCGGGFDSGGGGGCDSGGGGGGGCDSGGGGGCGEF